MAPKRTAPLLLRPKRDREGNIIRLAADGQVHSDANLVLGRSQVLAGQSRGRVGVSHVSNSVFGPGAQSISSTRADAPHRREFTRGTAPTFSNETERQSALEAFDADVYSRSASGPTMARRKFVESCMRDWGEDYPPISVEGVRRLGATLKAGGYRSAKLCLSTARVETQRALGDKPFPAALSRAFADAERSCLRGLGPSQGACGLQLEILTSLDEMEEPLTSGGPIAPRDAVVAGTWWLTREIELSAAKVCHITLKGEGRSLTATWLLPVSKTDQQALGCERTHGCCCNELDPYLCPSHTLQRQLSRLEGRFGQDWLLLPDSPLWPDRDGMTVKKAAVVLTIQELATRAGLNPRRSDGLNRFSGHSLRVEGAQQMARAGLEPMLICLFGRWGSSAVLSYLREAPLSTSSSWSTRTARANQLAKPQDFALDQAEAALNKSSGISGSLEADDHLMSLCVRVDELAAELRILKECQGPAAGAAVSSTLGSESEFIINTSSGCVHRVACGVLALDSGKWKTLCGWRFGRLGVTRCNHLPPGAPVCDKCVPKIRRVEGEGQQSGSEEGGESPVQTGCPA